MNEAVQRVIDALRELDCNPKPRAGGGYTARCPAHDDHKPSLSVGTGDNGGAVVHCFAGCQNEAIVRELGLTMRDLCAVQGDSRSVGSGNRSPKAEPTVRVKRSKTFPTHEEAIRVYSRRHGCEPWKTWAYRNAEGEPVGYIARWNLPDGKGKDIRPVAKLEGGWACAGMPSPRPLFRLPDILAEETVYITEGEKCADIAVSCKLPATTSPHGANGAKEADWSTLAGKNVVILRDHGDAGLHYAETVARLCQEARALSVRIVNLADHWPAIPDGGDIEQALELEDGDAEATGRAILALADKAEPINLEDWGDAPAQDEFQPFPVDALPAPLARFVREHSDAINCDASYVALPLLSMLASCIGNTHRAELEPGYTVPSILWTAIVGESGTAKSPAMEVALAALYAIQADAMREYQLCVDEWKPQHDRHEHIYAQWKKSGKGEPPIEPEKPKRPRYIVSDVTVEALAPILEENPRGVLAVYDELSGWIGGFDRYAKGKGGDVAHWLSMHSGAPMTVDRKTAGCYFIPRASVSLTGGIQPGALRRTLGKSQIENGLAMRLLFAYPPRRPRCFTDAVVAEGTNRSVTEIVRRLVALQGREDDDGEPQPFMVPLSSGAKPVWRDFKDANGQEQMDHTGAMASVYSKMESAAGRLALILQLVKEASVATGASVTVASGASEIEADTLRSAIVLARWFIREAARIFAFLEESESDAESRELVEWISQRGGGTSVRDITRGRRKYRKKEDAQAAADRLVEQGHARWDDGNGRGRRIVLLRSRPRRGDGDTGDTTRGANPERRNGDGDSGDTGDTRTRSEPSRHGGDGDSGDDRDDSDASTCAESQCMESWYFQGGH